MKIFLMYFQKWTKIGCPYFWPYNQDLIWELRICNPVGKSENIFFQIFNDKKSLKSTQNKKLAPNLLRFKYQNLKSWKSHEKNETKNIRLLVFNFSSTNLVHILMFFVLFFMWFPRFQILNHKAFGASFLFWVDFKNAYSDRSSFNPFIWGRLLLRPEFHSNCEFFKNSAVICFNTIWAEFCSEFHIVISKYFESNSYGSWLQLLWFMTHPFFNWFPGIKDYSNWPIIPQIRSEFFKNSNWSR